MSDIFISYARPDLEAARRLAGVLEKQGWSVFWDRTIPAGRAWREVIGTALADARCVVVLWSEHSVTSHWVLEEAEHGLKRRALIPAVIEGVEPPFGFGSIQAADLSTWAVNDQDTAIQQFLGDVAGVLGPPPVVPAEERVKAEAEAQQKAEEQQRQQAEARAKRQLEQQRERAEAEGKLKAEEKRRRQAGEERQRVEAKAKAAEAMRRAGAGREGAVSAAMRLGEDEVKWGYTYLLQVYNYMGLGLAITGVVAFLVAATPALYVPIFTTPLKWVVMLAPLGFVFFLGAKIRTMSVSAAQLTFWAFAAVMGLSMASIFLVFTGESIARVFFITAAMFGAMSLYGYTTKRDLSGWGSFLFMGLIGIIIAMVVNIFLASAAVQFAISVIGVLVFTGLTAWGTRRVEELFHDHDVAGQKPIMGALALYSVIGLLLSRRLKAP